MKNFKLKIDVTGMWLITTCCCSVITMYLTTRYQQIEKQLRQSAYNAPIKSKLQHPPPGKPRAFDYFLCLGSGEFDG